MAVKVVDASAAAALLFVEPGHLGVARALEGADCVAPAFLELELGSVYLKKSRRDPASEPVLRAQLSLLPGLRVRLQAVPWDGALAVAQATGLSIYDAQYLWLARERSAELVTLDARLTQAAQRPHITPIARPKP